ncbi:tyrosine-type recombinase/integrase [Arthrobacter glacialis]|uniref:tyrosine-type recombinase/integrase n=1 Tax=Arthrobacter glacialis TaxID=1664 RepID=UPI000CD492F9|nr:site-specific integrase [Arthrobacter glacialis]POH57483.1 site-specific integrase [Arthrobacter glacialis]
MASVVQRRSKSGTTSFQVRWRDPDVAQQQSVTFVSEVDAKLLKKFLDRNGQSFGIAQKAMESSRRKVLTVAEVIQEHIDLLVRPASGTLRTYQTMLDLHIKPVLGAILIDELDMRQITGWVRGMQKKGKTAKTIRNNHSLIFASMERAVLLKYRPDNPCRGVELPSGDRVEDDARFLTHAEFSQILALMPERYKDFTQFLVMTGTRFGEATAVTVADVDLLAKPATVRITKAWKRDGNNEFYVGPTKTGAGKRTVSLAPILVEILIPLVASRQGSDLLFTTGTGGRIAHSIYWQKCWVPTVKGAQAAGLKKTPRIHDLRHTHASWLIQDGVSLFTISRRLGHASTRTTEEVYGHLMPQALQDGAESVQRSARIWGG